MAWAATISARRAVYGIDQHIKLNKAFGSPAKEWRR
ncbi:hypothetical protein RLEG3_03120 (plasmid) [Rhizobium leguminosarum bv. trifolii WSM1689]|nr:hypothetical protein RLEG3_03120 [Rhizobium leguminosarum bv. trifolii WSM1689]